MHAARLYGSPFLAFGMLAAMLSLAGVPFTAGFVGKFLVFAAAVREHQFVLIGVGIITVAAGFYFYLRVVAAMYWQEPNDDTPSAQLLLSRVERVDRPGLSATTAYGLLLVAADRHDEVEVGAQSLGQVGRRPSGLQRRLAPVDPGDHRLHRCHLPPR